MQLEEIQLYNFCQHRRRCDQLRPGLTAVMGANGSGKSNYLGAFRWLLTGENPNQGNVAENITQGCDGDSYGQLTFSHAGVRAVVTRYQQPARRKPTLVITAEGRVVDTVTGVDQVNTRIEQILQCRAETINEIIFVAQDNLFGFLAKTPAKRAEIFQRLFHLELANAIYGALTKHLGTISLSEVAAEQDRVRTQIVTLQQQLQQTQANVANLPTLDTLLLADREAGRVWSAYEEWQRLARQLQEQQQRLSQLPEPMAQAQQLVTVLTGNVAALESAVTAARSRATTAQQVLQQHQQYQANRTALSQLRMQIAGQEQAAAKPAPVKPADYPADYQVLDDTVRELELTIAQTDRMTRDLTANQAACPTCCTPVTPQLLTTLQQRQAARPGQQQQVATLKAAKARALDYDLQVQRHQQSVTQAQAQLTFLRQQEAVLALMAAPPGDPAEAAQATQALAQAETSLRQTRQQLQTAQNQLASLQGQQATLTTAVATLQGTVAEAEGRAAGWEGVQATHSFRQAQIAQRREADQAIIRDQALLMQAHTRELELAQQAAVNAVRTRWRDQVTTWQQLVHWSNLPQAIIQQNLQRLSVAGNQVLEQFETDFRISADDELSFLATFADGRQQPSYRLSWGQKAVLATATRVALNLSVASHVGALALDEPTAYLDKHHIRGFAPVLRHLREFAASRNLQCIIVTHEDSLAPLFDGVIQL